MNIMWPKYLIRAKSYISSNSNVRFLLITSTKMYRNDLVKERKVEFCIREASVTVLEINDFKQEGFFALEIFFINLNSYMNEMHTDCVVLEELRVELLVSEGLRVDHLALEGLRVDCLVLKRVRVDFLVLEGVMVELLVLEGVRVELLVLDGVRVSFLVL